jgi:tight adherence protein C
MNTALLAGLSAGLGVFFFLLYLDLRRRGRFAVLSGIEAAAVYRTGTGWAHSLAAALMPLVTVVFPENTRAETEKKLTWAGIEELSAAEFLATKLAAAAGIFAAGGFVSLLSGAAYFWFLALGALGYFAPDLWLARKVSARQKEIRRDMMEFSTLLSTVLAAGADIYDALVHVGRWFGGPLGREVMRAVHDIASGKRRSQALLDMAERCGVDELTQLVQVIVQADRYGTPVAKAINEHAAQVRVLRRYTAEKQAGEAAVKMTLPMLLFIVGPLLALLLYPAMRQFQGLLF